LATLLNGTLPKKIEVILERAGFAGTNLRHLVFRLGTNAKNIKEALQSILSQKSALITDKEETNIISASFYEKLAQSAAEIISQYQKKNPLREGISKEELKASLGRDISPKLFFMLLQNLADQKKIEVDKETVRLFGHKVTLADDLNSIRQEILKIYNEAGLTPPSFKDVINNFQDKKTEAQNIIKLLLKDGSLIKINEELIFTREALDNLRKNYKALLVKEGKATPVSFKELTGLSRKYIIPLMEYFDTDKLTMRVGDHRILREKE